MARAFWSSSTLGAEHGDEAADSLLSYTCKGTSKERLILPIMAPAAANGLLSGLEDQPKDPLHGQFRPNIVISYAHRDESWAIRLVQHLAVLERRNILGIWEDRRIDPGQDWLEEIRGAISSAFLAVLLVSADFLASEFIQREEVPQLLEQRKHQGMHLVPILVRDCVWEEVPWLATLQMRPRHGRPLAVRRTAQVDTELTLVVREILKLIKAE